MHSFRIFINALVEEFFDVKFGNLLTFEFSPSGKKIEPML
jgi:hypothetical protein